MHSSDFSLFGFFTLRIYLWTDRVNFTSASLLRPDSPPAFRLSRSIYTKIRIAARNRGRGNRVPLAVISIFIRSRKRFSRVDAYRSETKRDRPAWKNADEAVCACAFAVSRGCGEKRRGCFHHYVYVLPDVVTCSRELLGSRMETGNSFFEKFE